MNALVALNLLLRLLPSILLLICAILVVRDASMRERWTDLLVKTGSIKAADREDESIQAGVKVPFFVLAGLFLIWPCWYMYHDSYAQRPVEMVPLPVVAQPTPKGKAATPTPMPTPTPSVTMPDAPGARPAPGAPGAPQPNNPMAPAQPVAPPTPAPLRG